MRDGVLRAPRAHGVACGPHCGPHCGRCSASSATGRSCTGRSQQRCRNCRRGCHNYACAARWADKPTREDGCGRHLRCSAAHHRGRGGTECCCSVCRHWCWSLHRTACRFRRVSECDAAPRSLAGGGGRPAGVLRLSRALHGPGDAAGVRPLVLPRLHGAGGIAPCIHRCGRLIDACWQACCRLSVVPLLPHPQLWRAQSVRVSRARLCGERAREAAGDPGGGACGWCRGGCRSSERRWLALSYVSQRVDSHTDEPIFRSLLRHRGRAAMHSSAYCCCVYSTAKAACRQC